MVKKLAGFLVIARCFEVIIVAGALALPIGVGAQQQQPRYIPCIDGPKYLKQIDEAERGGQDFTLTDGKGQKITVEMFAEIHIADCSNAIAIFNLLEDRSAPSLYSIRRSWETNLEFMKWWLQNRRDKKKN